MTWIFYHIVSVNYLTVSCYVVFSRYSQVWLKCGGTTYGIGFEVPTAVSMKIAVFWVVAPCSLVEVYS
jgi:hypothetical protein